jgi:hypothetical protein
MDFHLPMIKTNTDDIIIYKHYDESDNTLHIHIINPSIMYIKMQSKGHKTYDERIIIGKYKKKISEIESSLIENNYFTRNSFICTSDELFKKELTKSKSDNCLDYIEVNVSDLKQQYLLDINKYTKLLYDLIRNEIIDLIKETISKWYSDVYSIFNETLVHYKNLLDKNNQDLMFCKLIKETFNNYISSNKNILIIIKELLEKVKLLKYAEEYIDILNWINSEFKRLNKNNSIVINIHKLSIKERLKEQHKIIKILDYVLINKFPTY